jgi:uncharacterized repeat protein (TIGR03803 family)
VYKLSPASNGHWKETILYHLQGGTQGFSPTTGVVIDRSGNIYGTTIAGGDPLCGCGVVFKLAPNSDGTWTYSLLHTFLGTDGAQPNAKLVLYNDRLYGTAAMRSRRSCLSKSVSERTESALKIPLSC